MPANVRVIVLAAQRKGVVDPLAARFGVSHKCLVPLEERALIAHVVGTVASHPLVSEVMISVEADAFADVGRALEPVGPGAERVRQVTAADNLADSVSLAAQAHPGPIIITTADNVLLSHASLDAMIEALGTSDVALAMARREAVLAAHPDGQRRFYAFRDGEFSNCNLYGLANASALGAAEIFRGGGQFARKVGRVIQAFGLVNLILLRLNAITLEKGLARISRRIGLSIRLVVLPDGRQAIDVDNDRTYGVVSALLSAAGGAGQA